MERIYRCIAMRHCYASSVGNIGSQDRLNVWAGSGGITLMLAREDVREDLDKRASMLVKLLLFSGLVENV